MCSCISCNKRDTATCNDCNKPVKDEWYMVHHEVWSKAYLSSGFLCILCLEKRIGRALSRTDFQEWTSFNYNGERSEILKSRVERKRTYTKVHN